MEFGKLAEYSFDFILFYIIRMQQNYKIIFQFEQIIIRYRFVARTVLVFFWNQLQLNAAQEKCRVPTEFIPFWIPFYALERHIQ